MTAWANVGTAAPGRATAVCLLLVAALSLGRPAAAHAQFEEPCELACIGVLAATGFVTATGVTVAYGRITGGLTSVNQGVFLWGGTFLAMTATGMSLSGNGERQERAVYAAGIGALSGALIGFTVESLRTRRDDPRVLAGTLMGAAVGALAAGVYGVLTYEDGDAVGTPVPLLTLSLPF